MCDALDESRTFLLRKRDRVWRYVYICEWKWIYNLYIKCTRVICVCTTHMLCADNPCWMRAHEHTSTRNLNSITKRLKWNPDFLINYNKTAHKRDMSCRGCRAHSSSIYVQYLYCIYVHVFLIMYIFVGDKSSSYLYIFKTSIYRPPARNHGKESNSIFEHGGVCNPHI